MNKRELDPHLREVVAAFDIPGDPVAAVPYGTGHINDTFLVTFNQAGTLVNYTLQRINTHVFPKPELLMENVLRVTSHARATLLATGTPDASRRALALVNPRAGGAMVHDSRGNVWRCYLFIEQCHTVDVVDTPEMAFEAARAFARFQGLLADMPGGRLQETLPNFHNTPIRYRRFHEVLQADKLGRAEAIAPEIEFALAQEATAGRLVELIASGDIPERATHNDTKINNVLLDNTTGEGICVIDLDTLMPGSALYDFGDMVRSATLNMAEDSTDYKSVVCRRDIFEALASGYLGSATFLNRSERANMAFSGGLITLECGLRFLTDYLEGDVYFKIQRPQHNLDRCRTQFALVRSIQEQEAELQAFCDQL